MEARLEGVEGSESDVDWIGGGEVVVVVVAVAVVVVVEEGIDGVYVVEVLMVLGTAAVGGSGEGEVARVRRI